MIGGFRFQNTRIFSNYLNQVCNKTNMAAALPKPSNQQKLDENQEFVKTLNQRIGHKMKSQFENNISTELSNIISSYYFDGHVSFIFWNILINSKFSM